MMVRAGEGADGDCGRGPAHAGGHYHGRGHQHQVHRGRPGLRTLRGAPAPPLNRWKPLELWKPWEPWKPCKLWKLWDRWNPQL